jgi:hypothetical protein
MNNKCVGKMFLFLIAMCVFSALAFAEPLSFSGRVEKGGRYEYPLDNGLVFRLLPNSAGSPPGWVITVAKADRSRDDYVWVVTPPYRFWNPRYIDISYGTSAREAAQITPREFYFVTNEPDYKTASEALDIILWPNNYKKKEIQNANDKLGAVSKMKGVFTIINADLSSSPDGIQEIRSMEFKVEIDGYDCGS